MEIKRSDLIKHRKAEQEANFLKATIEGEVPETGPGYVFFKN